VHEIYSQSVLAPRRWSTRSVAILVFAWLILQIGCLFSPGLLDDVDSIYIQIAREMLLRHDYVTPYINGIRFFDKPPLMYWMAAGSMHIFGAHDWAARLPLALCVLILFLAVYALGIRLFSSVSPAAHPDRGGFYAALALATSLGPYLYTRFYIPDILLALWMTLAVHLFLITLDRLHESEPRTLLPCVAFAAVLALNVLTKGIIGLVFPIAFVFLYLAITKQLHLLLKFHPLSSTAAFLLVAAPWHILAALRTPPIPLPTGLGLPPTGGWAWFYLYNEHIARFLGHRIPHDYGQTPVWLFWIYAIIWIMPWATFLPRAIATHLVALKTKLTPQDEQFDLASTHDREAAVTLLLWSLLVLIFFSISSRQEYYSLPAIPALALMAGGLLARADRRSQPFSQQLQSTAAQSALSWHLYFLFPVATVIAFFCAWFAITAPHPAPQTDISTLLSANPEFYNLSLGHLFDLTGAAMGLFRGPLTAVALSMLVIGLGSYLLRRRGNTYTSNITLAAAMMVTLLAAHTGLARFYPILGSKQLALAILDTQQASPAPSGQPDLILLDGELTGGSSLIFYTGQQLHLVDGRVNGLWYGSFWPDAPPIFENESTLRQLWQSPRRIFFLTGNATPRTRDLTPYGPVHTIASAGGKTILTNH
jgi:4-amino-4-deoxy-L-arabinose transferase-like glycosyltransferase